MWDFHHAITCHHMLSHAITRLSHVIIIWLLLLLFSPATFGGIRAAQPAAWMRAVWDGSWQIWRRRFWFQRFTSRGGCHYGSTDGGALRTWFHTTFGGLSLWKWGVWRLEVIARLSTFSRADIKRNPATVSECYLCHWFFCSCFS